MTSFRIPASMLLPLLADQPVLVNGQLLPADDPRALLQLETLVSNWLVRTAELIGLSCWRPVVTGRATSLSARGSPAGHPGIGSSAQPAQHAAALVRMD